MFHDNLEKLTRYDNCYQLKKTMISNNFQSVDITSSFFSNTEG